MSLRKNVAANYLGQGWTALINLAFIPVYIEHLGIEAYGLIGFFAVLQSWLTLLDMGMTPTLNREMALYTSGNHSAESIGSLLRTIEVICITTATLIAITVHYMANEIADSWIKSSKLSIATVSEALSIMGLVFALRIWEGIYRGALLGLQRQVWFNAVSAAFSTLRYGGAVAVLVWYSPTIQAFFVWQLMVSVFSLIVFAMAVHNALPHSFTRSKFSGKSLKRIWRFSGGMMGISVLSLLLTQLDKLLLSRLVNLDVFGYYTLAATVAAAIYMAIGPVTQAVYPRLVQHYASGSRSDLVSLYHDGAQFVTVITAPALILLSMHSENVIFVWSGNTELAHNVAPILSILSVGAFLNGLMHMPYQLQLSHGWVSFALRVNIIAVTCMVPAIIWSVSWFGAVGAAYCWLILNAGYTLIAIQFMHRRLLPGEKWRWYFQDVSLPVAGSFFCALAIFPFRPDNLIDRSHWLIYLLVVGAAALLSAAILSSFIRDRVRKSLLAVAR